MFLLERPTAMVALTSLEGGVVGLILSLTNI